MVLARGEDAPSAAPAAQTAVQSDSARPVGSFVTDLEAAADAGSTGPAPPVQSAPAKKRRNRGKNKEKAAPQASDEGRLDDKQQAAVQALLAAGSGNVAGKSGGRGDGRRGGSGRGGSRKAASLQEWWRRMPDTDPISLEPLSQNPYPPLNLSPDEAGTVEQWFDGRILASYLVSTGRFVHPTSRRDLGPAECDEIDAYLTLHRIGRAQCRAAWECRDSYNVSPPEGGAAQGHPVSLATIILSLVCELSSDASGADDASSQAARLAALRQEADAVLRSLFGSSAGIPAALGTGSGGQGRGRGRGASSSSMSLNGRPS